MEKIAMQNNIFEDRPSNGIYLNHAESQYKDDEAEENVQDNVPVQQQEQFQNPSGSEE